MREKQTMIETRELVKWYRTGAGQTTALAGVNLRIEEGEFVAVMGPSGCGKSTLLNLLGLLDNPSRGEYYLLGREVSRYSEAQRARLRKSTVGFIFQRFNLIETLTVYENVELPLHYQRQPPGERRRRVGEVLERLGLSGRQQRFPAQLSGGEQQRVAVARALAAGGRLLLADEPTGNLDSHHGAEVLSLLSSLQGEGSTIVLVTHSAAYAQCAGRVIALLDGRVVDGGGER